MNSASADGQRIIAATALWKYQSMMDKERMKFERAVDEFIDNHIEDYVEETRDVESKLTDAVYAAFWQFTEECDYTIVKAFLNNRQII